MNRAFILILFSSRGASSGYKESLIMLKNVISEIYHSDMIEMDKNTVHILCDEKDAPNLEESLEYFSKQVSFHFLRDSYSDLDMMNHHLNTHIQRAAVSTDVNYLLVISGDLPIFSNQVFSEHIDWESDINIAFSQDQNSSMILFKRQFTPFFFRLSDTTIRTGERSLTLFQQYKRGVNVIKQPFFYELDKNNAEVYDFIKESLKREKNIHQTELFHLLSD